MRRLVGWLLLFLVVPAYPCTVFSSHGIVAKTLDWSSGKGLLYVNKRDVAKHAIFVNEQKALSWVSQHASVTATETGLDFPWEGMNDAGLSVDVLELIPSVAPPSTDPKPAVSFVQWVQYILDTSADLPEAIHNAKAIRVEGTITTHYFVCDAHGACGVFEYLDGRLVIHDERSLPFEALANDRYEQEVSYFERLRGSHTPQSILSNLSPNSFDRFSRAVLWSLQFQTSPDNFTAYAFKALDNVSEIQPLYQTYWEMVFDLKSQVFRIRTLASQKVKAIALSKFDPHCSSGVKYLDVNASLSGNVEGAFKAYSPEANQTLASDSAFMTRKVSEAVASYPEKETHCQE